MAREGLLIEKRYRIPLEMFREAFTAFQKQFVYPRTYLWMGIFLLVAGIYAYFFAVSEKNTMLYGLLALTFLILAGFEWYKPRKVRRNLMEAVKEIENDEYRLQIYPDCLEIGTMLPETEETRARDDLFEDEPEENFSGTRIYYNKGLHVTEYERFYMMYQQKTMFYVVPKSEFNEEEQEILRVHFEGKLAGNYRQNPDKGGRKDKE